MSQAEDLLNSTSPDDISTHNTIEEPIIVGNDRFITVPDMLKRIAVQYDHNVETVTFNCPRYWDDNDLSTMYIYINFVRSDNAMGKYLVENVRVDDTDSNIIHFEWTIGKDVTMSKGKIRFLVCAVTTDEEGNEELHWNSELNEEMFVSEGLETSESVISDYPDIITDLLARMDKLTGDGIPIDGSLTLPGIAADAAVVGERLKNIDDNIDGINDELDRLDKETVKEEVDPTVPDWAKEPKKPSYNHNELTDGETLAVKDGTLQTNLNAEMLGGRTLSGLHDIGEIRTFGNEKSIINYLLCDGSTVQAADYPVLHSQLKPTLFNKFEDAGNFPTSSYRYLETSSSSPYWSPLFKIGNQYIMIHKNIDDRSKVYYSTDLITWTEGAQTTLDTHIVLDKTKQIGNKIYAYATSSAGYPHMIIISNGTTISDKSLVSNKDYDIHAIDGYENAVVVIGDQEDKNGLVYYSTDGGSTWTKGTAAAMVKNINGLVYYNNAFYASNTTSAGFIQCSTDNGKTFGSYQTNISDTIETLYTAGGKLISRTTDGKVYASTSYNDLVRLGTDTYTNLHVIDNNLYGKIGNKIYKIDVITGNKLYINDFVEVFDKYRYFYIENGYAYTIFHNTKEDSTATNWKISCDKIQKTNIYGGTLPNIENSSKNGYHYIKAK